MTIAQVFFDNSLRVENMIWLPGAIADQEALSEAFENFVNDDMPSNVDRPVYAQLPALQQFAGMDDLPEPEDVAEVLLNTPGFLFQLARPVYRYRDGKMAEFSWGYYHTEWLYAETIEQICERAIEQVTRWEEQDQTPSLASKEG